MIIKEAAVIMKQGLIGGREILIPYGRIQSAKFNLS